jgi:hypothetical protein
MITESSYQRILAGYRGSSVVDGIGERLVELWCGDYYATNPKAELVTVDLSDAGTTFTYVFDIHLGRAIAAFGVPAFARHARDASRMAGHPLSAGTAFHRGHLMAHSIGGGADINLVPQLGKLNVGEFRKLERQVRELARQGQRCFYFVRTTYKGSSQTPAGFEQGVILPNGTLIYREHKNS